MIVRIFIVFLCLIICVHPFGARADIVNEFSQVQCFNELNALKIDLFNINGKISRENTVKNPLDIWEEEGIASAESLIEYDPDFSLQNTKSLQKQCRLFGEESANPQTYYINLESYVFSGDPNGQCGLARTFEITIKTNDQILVDKFRFRERCFSGQNIYSFILLPHEGYMMFEGTSPDLDGSRYDRSFYKMFWLKDPLPVTSEMVYALDDK